MSQTPDHDGLGLNQAKSTKRDRFTQGKAHASRGPLKRLFFGAHGLRAGWGLLLFVLFAALNFAVFLVVVAIIARAHGHFPAGGAHPRKLDLKRMSPAILAISEGVMLASFMLATVVMGWIERRPLASLGFDLRGLPLRFVQGLLAGLSLLAALVASLWLVHAVSFGPVVWRGWSAVAGGLQWGGVFLLVAGFEEVALRGYLLQTLARGLNFRWAAVISSALFMALHISNGGETLFGLSQVFVIGLVFCLSVWKTGALWWAIGYHAAWDWAQSFLFGVADSGESISGALMTARPIGPAWLSGGTTGPEGSALALAAIAATAALIVLTLKKPDHVLPVRW